MPIARPEFGPSLVDIVAPRARRVSRRSWIVAGALVALLLAAIAAVLIARSRPETQVIIRGPLTFNTRFDDRTQRLPAEPGELLRLHVSAVQGAGGALKRGEETLVFRDGGPPPTRSEPAGAPIAQLSLRMVGIMRKVRAELAAIPGSDFQLRGEGRVKIGKDNAGWLVRYQYRSGPANQKRIYYGVRLLLLPDVIGTRERVLDMSLRTESSPVVPNIRLAGSNGPMRTPFYGIAFGTEAP